MTANTPLDSAPMHGDDNLAADEVLAFQSFRRAADSGQADAAYCVAKMYLSGVGCETNMELCRRYV